MALYLYLYLGIAIVFAGGSFLATGWFREEGIPAPDRSGSLALLAGLLWPLMAIGLLQAGVWTLVVTLVRSPVPNREASPTRTPHPELDLALVR